MNYNYTLQNLNCAHCAGKIEQKIASTEGFENVSFNFATKKLSFATDKKEPLDEIQAICDSIEDGVTVVNNDVNFDREKNKGRLKASTAMLIAAVVFGVGALAIEIFASQFAVSYWFELGLSLAAVVLAGYKTFIKGIKNLVKFRFEEAGLLTIAVIAAIFLGEFVEAAMVTVLFAAGEFIEDKAVNASRRDIEKLAQIRPDRATVLIDGIEKNLPAKEVKVGSTVIIKPYERVPLDGIIISGETTLDNSALTGESMPVDAAKGSEVLSGAVNGGGLIQIKTTKEFGDSTATRILKLVEEAASKKGKSEKLISRFASVYTPVVMIIALLIAVVPPLLGLGAFSKWLYRALVCLVASCPCAIVISVPLSYYSGIGAASKFGVLIKGGKYLEVLSRADTFVFDKTGTLTTGKLSVTEVNALDGCTSEQVLALAAAAERYSSHPIAQAIKAKAEGLQLPTLEQYSEKAGCGTSAVYKGKSVVCGGSKALTLEQKAIAPKDASVFLLYDGKLIGTISVSDTLRPEAKQVISQLHSLGAGNTVMLTGDSYNAAKRVSKELGLNDFKAELLPADKLSAFNNEKKNSKAACFVGDGINDAPVLAASDCAIAMGFGSDAAIEASDVVLASGTLENLSKAVRLSRKVMQTVRTNIVFALTVKAAVIILAALGLAAMWMSVIADTGVSVACVLYAARLLKKGK